MKESDLTKKTLEATMRVEAAPEMASALLGDGESSAGSRELAVAGRGTQSALQVLSDLQSGGTGGSAAPSAKGTSATYVRARSMLRVGVCIIPAHLRQSQGEGQSKGPSQRADPPHPKGDCR